MRRVPSFSSDMNITPMIDVLLVLLVIFMAALPLSQRGIDVRLPQQVAQPSAAASESIMIEISRTRTMAINRQPVTMGDLGPTLARIFESRLNKTLYVSGAPSLPYDDVVRVLDVARGVGVVEIGVITADMRAGYPTP